MDLACCAVNVRTCHVCEEAIVQSVSAICLVQSLSIDLQASTGCSITCTHCGIHTAVYIQQIYATVYINTSRSSTYVWDTHISLVHIPAAAAHMSCGVIVQQQSVGFFGQTYAATSFFRILFCCLRRGAASWGGASITHALLALPADGSHPRL